MTGEWNLDLDLECSVFSFVSVWPLSNLLNIKSLAEQLRESVAAERFDGEDVWEPKKLVKDGTAAFLLLESPKCGGKKGISGIRALVPGLLHRRGKRGDGLLFWYG